MLDPMNIVEGTMAGIASSKAAKALDAKQRDVPDQNEDIIHLLREIRDALYPNESQNVDIDFQLQPYPLEYAIDPYWLGKPHFCFFLPASTPLRIDIDGIGTYLKTLGPGWFQADVRGRMSTTDSQSHSIKISYRVDALGVSI